MSMSDPSSVVLEERDLAWYENYLLQIHPSLLAQDSDSDLIPVPFPEVDPELEHRSPLALPEPALPEPALSLPTQEKVFADVHLLHKPKGMRQPQLIGAGDQLRVTTNKSKGKVSGKNLQLAIRLSQQVKDLAVNNIYLDDLDTNVRYEQSTNYTQPDDKNSSFTLTDLKPQRAYDEQTSSSMICYNVKLIKLGDHLRFAVVLWGKSHLSDTAGGVEIYSVVFSSHNNGKKPTKLQVPSSGSLSLSSSPTPGSHLMSRSPISSKLDEREGDYLQAAQDSLAKRKRGDVEGSGGEVYQTVAGSLHVLGKVRAREFVETSDERLKMNVEDLVDALDIVLSLQGKTYQWKDDLPLPNTGGRRVIGLIAQQVQTVLPQAVYTDPETNLLAVRYTALVPVLIEALKEHIGEYKESKSKFETQLKDIQSKVDTLYLLSRPAPTPTLTPTPTPTFLNTVSRQEEGESGRGKVKKEAEEEEEVLNLLRVRRGYQVKKMVEKVTEEGLKNGAVGAVVLDWQKGSLPQPPTLRVLDKNLPLTISSSSSSSSLSNNQFSCSLTGRLLKLVFLYSPPHSLHSLVHFPLSSLYTFLQARAVLTVMDFRDPKRVKQRRVASVNAKVLTEGNMWVVTGLWQNEEDERMNLIMHYLPASRSRPSFRSAINKAKKDWRESWRDSDLPKQERTFERKKEDWKRWKELNLHTYWPASFAFS